MKRRRKKNRALTLWLSGLLFVILVETSQSLLCLRWFNSILRGSQRRCGVCFSLVNIQLNKKSLYATGLGGTLKN